MEQKVFDVTVIRTGYGFSTQKVLADSQEEANRKALEVAGDIEFTEKLAEYGLESDPAPKRFPNGFTSWMETHHEIVERIALNLERENPNHITDTYNTGGKGAMYELAEAWTDEFEAKYKGVAWGEELEYFDTLESFLIEKVMN